MNPKKVKRLLYAEEIEMDSVPVKQAFPTQEVPQIDPFLLLHHYKVNLLPGSHPRQYGVDPHPHRGFSPITFVIKGSLHHRDSRGNSKLVEEGGIQWLDAGMGILHSERPGKKLAIKGGKLELIQVWLNTPQKYKMDEPRYFALQKEEIPIAKTENFTSYIISGTYEETFGLIKTKTPTLISNTFIKQEAVFSQQINQNYNAVLYLIKGKIKLKGYGLVEAAHAVYFEKEEGLLEMEALEDTQVLLLSGLPINEPIVTHGPFVMNTQTEIMMAMRDYQMGKMGILIEEY